jgi:filamentous hemagglutinin family protein
MQSSPPPGPNLASPPTPPKSTQASRLRFALRRWTLNVERWPFGPSPLRPVLSLAGLATALAPFLAPANPAGLVVAAGSASAVAQGNHLQVTASHNAFLNWQSFDIAPGERTSFLQPSAASVVWNRIEASNPSAIFGQLDANGVVVLVNSAGFHFGPEAVVSAAGLVVSTAPAVPLDSGSGLFWQFQGAPPTAAIVNYGRVDVGPGGHAFLIAERLENHGDISAPGGTLGLYAGREVLLSERPDGRGLSATVRLPSGAIDNTGRLVADAGTVALHARVVNQGGLVQADAVREQGGVIELVAADNLSLGAGSTTRAGAPEAGGPEAPGRILLEAGRNIALATGATVVADHDTSATLRAGRDFGTPDAVQAGIGNVTLAGNATLEARNGDVVVTAGNSVTVASGALRTTAGGDLAVTAVAGNLHTGTRPNGFQFRPTGYLVDPALGGISTAAGGNVSLTAGLDITSYLPLPGGTQTDGGSGAFGPEPGDVTIHAGRDVSGHFVLRNGTGSIEAGRDAGIPTRLLALSLVDGDWSVTAKRDLLLQEIRNPNGVFNNLGSTTSPNRHRFDYTPEASASLHAGNSVQLRGTALPRYADAFSQGLPPIYPGTLDITAGAGGVTLGNDLLLFPSPRGNLAITTTDGGSLSGSRPGDLVQLVLSDSAKTQYRAFGDFGISDHGPGLLHRDDPEPVRLAVAGHLEGILLGVPKRAEIDVGGNLVNSRFDGQNLRADDVTRLRVAGDILNRNEFTSVPLAAAPDFSPFDLDLIYPTPSGGLVGLENRFAYNPVTKSLTFQGRLSGDELQLLLAAPVRQFDASGAPLLLPNGEPVTRPVALLPPEVAHQLYDLSQDIPLNPDTGYRIGGGGRFEISARNLDLGATAGIVSQGPRANPALARLFERGADVTITTTGDLDLFSTRIASLGGGHLSIFAGGRINAGSKDFTPTDASARGILTVDPSDVTVVARGDIAINGSRIAAYDGGRVTVRSLEGDIDAGSGAAGSATVEKIHVDPVTREIRSYSPTIPGSGILATTFPPSLDPAFPPSRTTVGDILVETPRGDILASAGGVVQIPLNGSAATAGNVTLRAGTRAADGTVVHVGNIDASGSGVIGSTVKLEASGSIRGLVFARENIDLSAVQNVSVTALAQGSVNVSAAGNVSGTLIGIGSVTASSGGTVDAALLSQNVNASGTVASSQVGFSQGNAATATSQSVQSDEAAKPPADSESESEEEAQKKARAAAAAPRLVRTVGRVTVILPPSSTP